MVLRALAVAAVLGTIPAFGQMCIGRTGTYSNPGTTFMDGADDVTQIDVPNVAAAMETCCSLCSNREDEEIGNCQAWDTFPAGDNAWLCQLYITYNPNILAPGCDPLSAFGLLDDSTVSALTQTECFNPPPPPQPPRPRPKAPLLNLDTPPEAPGPKAPPPPKRKLRPPAFNGTPPPRGPGVKTSPPPPGGTGPPRPNKPPPHDGGGGGGKRPPAPKDSGPGPGPDGAARPPPRNGGDWPPGPAPPGGWEPAKQPPGAQRPALPPGQHTPPGVPGPLPTPAPPDAGVPGTPLEPGGWQGWPPAPSGGGGGIIVVPVPTPSGGGTVYVPVPSGGGGGGTVYVPVPSGDGGRGGGSPIDITVNIPGGTTANPSSPGASPAPGSSPGVSPGLSPSPSFSPGFSPVPAPGPGGSWSPQPDAGPGQAPSAAPAPESLLPVPAPAPEPAICSTRRPCNSTFFSLPTHKFGDEQHLISYPWQPEAAQAVADQFCTDSGYWGAGASRPFSLPANHVEQAPSFVTFDYACGEDGLDAPRQCVGMSCTAFAVIECVPHGELPCEPDEELNIGRGNTGVGNIGHFNEGSHNMGSYNTGSRNVGDRSMCSLCVGHALYGFGLLGPPALFLPSSAAEPTKEEL